MIRDGAIYNQAAAITTSDTVNLAKPTDAISVGTTGTLIAVFENDSVVTFAVTAAQLLPVRIKRVNASSTATGLVALYTV
jgi:threonine aldolase